MHALKLLYSLEHYITTKLPHLQQICHFLCGLAFGNGLLVALNNRI